MIEALDGDAERALTEELLDLIPISDVIPHNNLVVALVVIVAKVVLALQGPFDFLATLPDVEDLGVIKDLLHLEGGKILLEVLNSLRWVKRELKLILARDGVRGRLVRQLLLLVL